MAHITCYEKYVQATIANGLLRSTELKPTPKVDFSSVSYLNLHCHPSVKADAISAIANYGVGATGSRFLSGNYDICHELEEAVSRDKQHEASLLFQSGYQANTCVIESLCNKHVLGDVRPFLFVDKANHASVYHGVLCAVKSGIAKMMRYNNNDLEHLEYLLQKHHTSVKDIPIIISETVFGTNGHVVDLVNLKNIADKHCAILMLDEAHDIGIFGNKGLGLLQLLQMDKNIIITGSFGKALGVSGGYAICSKLMRDYFIQNGGSVIFSNNMSPSVVAACLSSWRVSQTLTYEREKILSLSQIVQHHLFGKFNGSHIFSIEINGGLSNIENIKTLFEKSGVSACFLRPPTTVVPTIKCAINSIHQEADINLLIDLLYEAKIMSS